MIHQNLIENYPGLFDDHIRISNGVYFADIEEDAGIVFDNDLSTGYYSEDENCFIGIELSSDFKAKLKSLEIYARDVEVVTDYTGSKIQGSLDGVNYVDIFEFIDSIDNGYNYFSIDDDTSYSVLRYIGNGLNPKSCNLQELKFFGFVYVETDSDFVCDEGSLLK